MMQPIKTAIFPVAGMGTRFLPVTKAGPKEMLPIVDKPLIQYVVEEAVAAGMTQIVFVTSSSKRAIEDYFDANYELEQHLVQKQMTDTLATVRNIIPSNVSIAYVRQSHPRGLGDAVLRGKNIVGNEPFAVLLADDIMQLGAKACLQQMVEIYEQTGGSVLAVEQVATDQTDKYGIVTLDQTQHNRVIEIVEKPSPAEAKSTLAVTGRYILTPKIFELLERTQYGHGGEIQLTDAISELLKEQRVSICPVKGRRFDCGSKTGFLEATIAFALERPDLRDAMQAMLSRFASTQEAHLAEESAL